MRKDYVYQDKSQFRLMQNAEKIGGFLVSDQDVIIDERVLPEQRFAHQPIFRRPPEELVTTFSYIHNFNQGVFSPANDAVRVANLFKKSSTTNPDGAHLLYKYTGWAGAPYLQSIQLKNWSAEAQATKRLIPLEGGGWGWIPIGNIFEGITLTTNNYPIFFKDYVFFWAPYNFTDAIYYAKLNAKKTETKEVKVAIHDSQKAFYSLGWLYVDNSDPDYGYKIVIYKQDSGIYGIPWNPYSENLVQYKANSLEGPWVYDKTWNTYTLTRGSPAYTAIVQELASLILSKTHNDLSVAVSNAHYDDATDDIISEAYNPPYYTGGGAWVRSRGNEGEIVSIWEPTLKNYLIKRLGNGQIKKTLITDIDQGFFD